MGCLICGHAATTEVVRVPSAPVLCNVLCETRAEALAVPRREIRLGYCPECGGLSNVAFDERAVRYGGAYENALHFSPVFRSYAAALARELVEIHDLRGKRVAEIGCGDGSFLGTLCRLGGNSGVGYDPAFDAGRAGPLPDGVRVVPRRFGADPEGEPADLLCCRHVLEHIADPVGFLRGVRRAVRPGAALYIEVPDATTMLRERRLWDLVYEHCLYFTSPALERALRGAGFEPMRTRSVYGGQFLAIDARAVGSPSPSGTGSSPAAAELVRGFAEDIQRRLGDWSTRLSGMEGTAAVWGAGSKGVMFLNMLPEAQRAVRQVVDVNPRKHGRFTAGSGLPIVGPESLRDRPPQAVILMNPIYRAEVADQLAGLGLDAELLPA